VSAASAADQPEPDTNRTLLPPDQPAGAGDERNVRTPPLVLAAFGAVLLIWGAGYVFNKLAATNADPLLAGVLRTVLAGLVLAPLLAIFRVPAPSGARDRAILCVAALGGAVFWPILLSLAAESTTASRTGLISAASPVFVAILALLVLGERFTWLKSLGMLVALGGVAWLISVRDGGDFGSGLNRGDLIMLVATAGVSVNYVGNGVLSRRYPAWSVTAYMLVIGAAVLLIPFLVLGLGPTMRIDASAWPSILYLAFISNIVGGSLWYWGLARGNISRLGAFQFLQPAVVVLLAAVFLGETVTIPMIMASVLILAGVYVVQR
jgi:drug/metabolite transporter (DMT)-like permease